MTLIIIGINVLTILTCHEYGRHWRLVVAGLPVLECGVEQTERADVEPPAADDGESDDLDDKEQRHLDDDVAEAEYPARLAEPEERRDFVQDHEGGTYHAVATQGCEHPFKVRTVDPIVDFEAHDHKVAYVVWREGCKKSKRIIIDSLKQHMVAFAFFCFVCQPEILQYN